MVKKIISFTLIAISILIINQLNFASTDNIKKEENLLKRICPVNKNHQCEITNKKHIKEWLKTTNFVLKRHTLSCKNRKQLIYIHNSIVSGNYQSAEYEIENDIACSTTQFNYRAKILKTYNDGKISLVEVGDITNEDNKIILRPLHTFVVTDDLYSLEEIKKQLI